MGCSDPPEGQGGQGGQSIISVRSGIADTKPGKSLRRLELVAKGDFDRPRHWTLFDVAVAAETLHCFKRNVRSTLADVVLACALG